MAVHYSRERRHALGNSEVLADVAAVEFFGEVAPHGRPYDIPENGICLEYPATILPFANGLTCAEGFRPLAGYQLLRADDLQAGDWVLSFPLDRQVVDVQVVKDEEPAAGFALIHAFVTVQFGDGSSATWPGYMMTYVAEPVRRNKAPQ